MNANLVSSFALPLSFVYSSTSILHPPFQPLRFVTFGVGLALASSPLVKSNLRNLVVVESYSKQITLR